MRLMTDLPGALCRYLENVQAVADLRELSQAADPLGTLIS